MFDQRRSAFGIAVAKCQSRQHCEAELNATSVKGWAQSLVALRTNGRFGPGHSSLDEVQIA